MEKKTRLILFAAAALIGLFVLAWVWWPEGSPKVDPAVVETAAENSRAAAAKQPPPPDPPVIIKGRARPGSLGGPAH